MPLLDILLPNRNKGFELAGFEKLSENSKLLTLNGKEHNSI
jgi:hypothetical protein